MIFPVGQRSIAIFEGGVMMGLGVHINEHLRMQVRVSEDRHPSPSAAICDAQSVKVGNPRCHSLGFDGGKMVKGRKRHVLVDTLGLVLMVIVTAAIISDQRGSQNTVLESSTPRCEFVPSSSDMGRCGLSRDKLL